MKYLTKRVYEKFLLSELSFTAHTTETYEELYELAFRKFYKQYFLEQQNFDLNFYKNLFEAELKYNSRLLRLLSRINEDKKILALGYASEKSIQRIQKYQKKLQNEYEKVKAYAYGKTLEACGEKKLHTQIYNGAIFEGLEKGKDCITLKLLEGDLIIENGEIIKGGDKPLYYYNEVWGPESSIAAAELYRTRRGYELQLLIHNHHTDKPVDLFYLTIRCTDIAELGAFAFFDALKR